MTEDTVKNYQDEFGQWVIQGRVVAGPKSEEEAIQLLNELDDPNRIIREKNPRISEIKIELDELDKKTIRALRSNESERIAEYENQAILLRQELSGLPEIIEHNAPS